MTDEEKRALSPTPGDAGAPEEDAVPPMDALPEEEESLPIPETEDEAAETVPETPRPRGKRDGYRTRAERYEEERSYMPVRSRRDGQIGCLGGLMYMVFILCASVVLACFGWMAASDVLALNKENAAVEVTAFDTAARPAAITCRVLEDEANGQ